MMIIVEDILVAVLRKIYQSVIINSEEWLVKSWLIIGIITAVAGFNGLIYQPLFGLLFFPVVLIAITVIKNVGHYFQFPYRQRIIFLILSAIWCFHLLGVMVPETGFDAVWYHLPVAKYFVTHHQFKYWPDYYQSVNPYFSDGLFLLGYLAGGEMGAKMVAWLLALSLLLIVNRLADHWLSGIWKWNLLISVSLIQVVTWQASSFYVDVAKAFWELAALWWLISGPAESTASFRQWLSRSGWSGLLWSAALATKEFSWLLWPVMMVIVGIRLRRWLPILIFGLNSWLLPIPYAWLSYQTTGQVGLSAMVHLNKLSEIGGQSQLPTYFFDRLLSLPGSVWQLTWARDYISPLIALWLILMVWQWWKNKYSRLSLILLIWGISQWSVWWWVPPLSTRYALSGFICLMILGYWSTYHWVTQKPRFNRVWWILVIVTQVSLLGPRFYVFNRQWPYLSGRQSKAEYLYQFFDGHIDAHLKEWHGLTP